MTIALFAAHTQEMRRTLAILKYVPAALCGLLAVAWVVSLYVGFGFVWLVYVSDVPHTFSLHCIRGTINCAFAWDYFGESELLCTPFGLNAGDWRFTVGYWGYWPAYANGVLVGHHISTPVLLLATAWLPFAICPFQRFRFPLWSYFAWNALVAVELAYYLR